jgi:hypothetical protein
MLRIAFPRNTFVWLVHAFYPILEFAAAFGEFLCDYIRTAWDIAADCWFELDELTDVKFVGWHGESVQRKAGTNVA